MIQEEPQQLLLANVYLHYVLDLWFEQEVQPRLKGRAFLIRYADDFVIGFTCEEDARRVLEVLPKRFGKYGLTIHPDKTRLVPFASPASSADGASGKRSSPGTFDLLGFTHFWCRSRRGFWVVKRRTAANRLQRAIRRIADWCRVHRHLPIPDQHQGKRNEKKRGRSSIWLGHVPSSGLGVVRRRRVCAWPSGYDSTTTPSSGS